MSAPAHVAAVLAKLDRVKSSGGRWTARCPAHEDENPSLSIAEGEGGRVLLHCHAGCSFESVREGLKASGADLRSETAEPVTAHARMRSARTKGEARETRYEIRNSAGEVIAFHDRVDRPSGSKSFTWRRPNGSSGLGGLKATDLPLFGSERLATTDGPVVLCEGEKAASALQGLGVLALGTVTGAGGTPSRESLAVLKDRDVYIWPDGDDVGRDHMQRIAEALCGVSSSVRLVDEELGNGYDAADLVARGGKLETVQWLMEKARSVPKASNREPRSLAPVASPQGAPFGLHIVSMGELLRESLPEIRWIVGDRLPAGGTSLLVAKPKVGKSTLARSLALAVARGEPWLGFETSGSVACYCGFEEKRSEVQEHFRGMGASESDEVGIFTGLPDRDFLNGLERWMSERKPGLVILDGLFRLVRVVDASDYASVSRAMEGIIGLAQRSGAHLLATHHSPKATGGDDVLGSTALFGSVDSLLKLKRSESGDRTFATVQRYGTDFPETMLVLDGEGRSRLGSSRADVEGERLSAGIVKALRDTPGQTEEEIQDRVEGRTGPKRAALRVLVESRVVERKGTGRKGDPYRYTASDSDARFLVPIPRWERGNEHFSGEA